MLSKFAPIVLTHILCFLARRIFPLSRCQGSHCEGMNVFHLLGQSLINQSLPLQDGLALELGRHNHSVELHTAAAIGKVLNVHVLGLEFLL